MDEEQILIDLKVGNTKAFDLLYDRLYEDVCYYAAILTKDEVEAQDIAINSITKFWETGVGKFETFAGVKAFIFKAARNAAIDYIRKNNVKRNHQGSLMYAASKQDEDLMELAEQTMYRLEMVKAVYAEIDKLPEQCRLAFTKVYVHNIPRQIVAEQLKISLDTVNSHLSHGRKKLRQVFGDKHLVTLLILIGLSGN